MKKVQHRFSISYALSHAIKILQKNHIHPASLDAEVLLAYVLKKDRAFVLAHSEYILTAAQQRVYNTAIKHRIRHTPVAYITGQKEFYGMNFFLDKHVLIPRPDTELLVQETLSLFKQYPEKTSLADIGTGSGCIVLSLASQAPQLQKIVATDYLKNALQISKKNARHLGLIKKVTFSHMNMMEKLKGRFDCIIANLPYLSAKEYADAVREYPEIKHEPKSALCSGKTGLELFNIFFQYVPQHINPNGIVLLEIGSGQRNSIKNLAKTYLPKNIKLSFIRDLAKRTRVAKIEFP